MWNLTASAYFNRRGMTPKTSIVHDTEMKVRIHGVTSQMNRFRYLAVRDHAGRTTAESRQLELNSAAQVASVTMVNKWRRWTVETLNGIRIDEQVCSTTHHHIVSATALIHRTARPSISAMSSLLGISPKCVQLVMIWFRSHVAAPHIQCLFSR